LGHSSCILEWNITLPSQNFHLKYSSLKTKIEGLKLRISLSEIPMEILIVVSSLIGGLLVLGWGADKFVAAASHLSRRLGISPVVIGLTVVAFGTSAPELAVNILATLKGNTGIAMGNVVGSNIFNIAFILGLCATITPLFVSAQLIRLDIPLMTASSVMLWFMAQDGQIGHMEGAILLLGIGVYTALQVKLALRGKNAEAEFAQEFSESAPPLREGVKLLLGLGMLVVGAKFFVDGAVSGARLLGWSEAVIGLTIIAAGTSLPEVATSVAATLKGERDIAIGNVVGSNVFNILGVIGISSILSPGALPVTEHMAKVDASFMAILAFMCMPFTFWRKKLERPVGVMFFMSWIIYTYYLISSQS
jgi:cation:H+ antiporter